MAIFSVKTAEQLTNLLNALRKNANGATKNTMGAKCLNFALMLADKEIKGLKFTKKTAIESRFFGEFLLKVLLLLHEPWS